MSYKREVQKVLNSTILYFVKVALDKFCINIITIITTITTAYYSLQNY